MSFRFRKSIQIIPGVRINLTTKGVSANVGPRGANVHVGQDGVHSNVSIPGTGLSSREKIADFDEERSSTPPVKQPPSTDADDGAKVLLLIGLLALLAIAWGIKNL